MKRTLRDFLSIKTLQYIKYIPISILKVRNWFPFLLNYLGIKNDNIEKIYYLRNGIKFKTTASLDVATIFVVFIREDYGKIPDNSVIVDIGANIGVFSVYAASSTQNSIIYAYEPMKDNYSNLLGNIQLNNCQNSVHTYQYAITSKREKRKLYISGSPLHSLFPKSNNQDSVEVECISLVDIFTDNELQYIDLIKLDSEGAEYEILYNTPSDYLKRVREIRMEYHGKKDYNIFDLKTFLEANGFTTTFFTKGYLWCKRTESHMTT